MRCLEDMIKKYNNGVGSWTSRLMPKARLATILESGPYPALDSNWDIRIVMHDYPASDPHVARI